MSDEDSLHTRFRAREACRFWWRGATRYGDLDTNAHVNNAALVAYLEEGRLAFRRDLVAGLELPDQLGWVVAALSVRFVGAAGYPGEIAIGVQPVTIGRTSFTLGYGGFQGGGCVLTAVTRSVAIDRATGASIPLPAPFAERLRDRLDGTP